MRKLIREAIFRLVRHDLVNVIEEHQEDLVAIRGGDDAGRPRNGNKVY